MWCYWTRHDIPVYHMSVYMYIFMYLFIYSLTCFLSLSLSSYSTSVLSYLMECYKMVEHTQHNNFTCIWLLKLILTVATSHHPIIPTWGYIIQHTVHISIHRSSDSGRSIQWQKVASVSSRLLETVIIQLTTWGVNFSCSRSCLLEQLLRNENWSCTISAVCCYLNKCIIE